MADERRPRLFVAIELPDEVRGEIADLQERLKKGIAFTKCHPAWVSTATLHLTLKFIGATDPGRVRRIIDDLHSVREGFAPFRMIFQGLGAFPHWNRPSVLYLAGREKKGNLAKLQSRIESRSYGWGTPADDHEYQPHITLCRFKAVRGVQEARRVALSHDKMATQSFEVREIVLFKSDLNPKGALHTPLERIRFKTPPVKTPS